MRILITGITGYIGSHLARSLLQKHQVFGLVREPVNTTYIDDIRKKLTLLPYDGSGVNLLEQMKACKPELVYHLATYYTGAHDMNNVIKLVNSNITLGAYLLEAMASCGCQNIIYASSIMEHYRAMEYCPLNLYAATKKAFHDLLSYYADAGILHAGTLVLSDTYGPGDKRSKILNIIQEYMGTDTPVALSDGQQDYAAVYIDDVIRAFELAGQQLCDRKWDNQIFQVLPDHNYTLQQTVDLLLEISGASICAQWGKRPPVDREIRKTVRLYPSVPGWAPKVTLKEGLRKIGGKAEK